MSSLMTLFRRHRLLSRRRDRIKCEFRIPPMVRGSMEESSRIRGLALISVRAYALQDTVKIDWATSDFEFPLEYISRMGCFHPALAGEDKISESTFDPNWK